jgi:predicted transcriptional regulator
MTNSVTRKHKVELADYPYHRDVTNRLLLSQLKDFEIATLQEIINGSLRTTVEQLASAIDLSTEQLLPLLKRLESVDLVKLDKSSLTINKEMRKYYCCELTKFSNSFEPDLQHLQALLHKVPIHILPLWYAIPRTSDNIFQSILERYFQTPKMYRKHLEELAIESPLLYQVFDLLQKTPDFCLPSSQIQQQFQLTPAQFHELVIALEYQFVCCLCYRQTAEGWQEYLILYQEWRQYQQFIRKNTPKTIEEETEIERTHRSDFGFIEDLATLTREWLKEPNTFIQVAPTRSAAEHVCMSYLPHVPAEKSSSYLKVLYQTATHLQLLTTEKDCGSVNSAHCQAWLQKNKQDQASDIYCLMLNYVRHSKPQALGCTERDFREIEKSLRSLAHKGWVYFDDFNKGMTAAIGKHATVALAQRGKKWRYALPQYDEDEKHLIYELIYQYFYYTAFVATGTHQGRPCLKLTPYGRMSLID